MSPGSSLGKIYDLWGKHLPSNALRIRCQRAKGVKIGQNVYLAYDVNIDSAVSRSWSRSRITRGSGYGVIILAHTRPGRRMDGVSGRAPRTGAHPASRGDRRGRHRHAGGHRGHVRDRARGQPGRRGRASLHRGRRHARTARGGAPSVQGPGRRGGVGKTDAADLAAKTHYAPSFCSGALWASNARFFRRSPGRYLGTLGAVFARTLGNPVHCLKSLGLFPVAVAFAETMRRSRIDRVHGAWATYAATAAYIVSRLLGIPYSFTAHASDATLIRAMMREKVRRAALVLTCTELNHRWLSRLVPEARDRIFLNYHGVFLDRFAPDGRSRSADPRPFHIVSCGSLYPRKGFPVLLEACRLLRDRGRDFRCTIIGEGPQRRRLERLIGRHRLAERVRLLGALSQSEVIAQYRTADLFVLSCVTDYLGWEWLRSQPVLLLEVGPAILFRPMTDGIPNVLVEAMAMALPAVATRVGGIPELIEDGRTGRLVSEGDPVALADAIELLHRHPELRCELGRNGRAAVQERFDRSKNIRDLVALFTGPVGRPGAAEGRDDGGSSPCPAKGNPARFSSPST